MDVGLISMDSANYKAKGRHTTDFLGKGGDFLPLGGLSSQNETACRNRKGQPGEIEGAPAVTPAQRLFFPAGFGVPFQDQVFSGRRSILAAQRVASG